MLGMVYHTYHNYMKNDNMLEKMFNFKYLFIIYEYNFNMMKIQNFMQLFYTVVAHTLYSIMIKSSDIMQFDRKIVLYKVSLYRQFQDKDVKVNFSHYWMAMCY